MEDGDGVVEVTNTADRDCESSGRLPRLLFVRITEELEETEGVFSSLTEDGVKVDAAMLRFLEF